MKNVRELITEIINKSDFDIYMNMLDKDISAYRLDKAKKQEIVEKSMAVAEECYQELLIKYGELPLTKYVIKSQVSIYYTNERPTKYYAYLGLFTEKTKTITINMETIKWIKEFAEQYYVCDLVDLSRLKDAVTAHELFHYFELVKPDLYTNQKILDAKIFGIIKTKSQLLAAGEVAAMHFAKIITKLGHSPLVYDKLFALGKKQFI